MTDSTRTRRLRGILIAATLLFSFALQVQVARIPDTMGDVVELGRWSQRVSELGLNKAYFAPRIIPDDYINYPPVSPRLFAMAARLRIDFPVVMTDPHRNNIDFFIKLPAVLAVIGTALCLFVFLRQRSDFKTAYVVMLTYAFNPAVIFITAYWGQLEPLFMLPVLLAFHSLYMGNSLSWGFATLAVLTKAHAAPFAPIVALVTLRNKGWSGVARGVVASLSTILLVLFPFIVEGNGLRILERMVADLSSSSLASQNGHNFWWIVTWGRWITVPSYRIAGFAIFGTIYAAVLFALWRRPRTGTDDQEGENFSLVYLAGALLACAFFLFMTGMHENHLFAVLPFLAMTVHLDRRLAVIYACFTLTTLFNMVLHDPYIETEYIRGGTYRPEQIFEYDLSPMPKGQLVATLLNSLANLGLGIALAYVFVSRLWRSSPANSDGVGA